MPSNNVWALNTPTGGEVELTTPSGQTCRARKLSIEGMVERGILAHADSLTATIQKYTKKVRTKNASKDAPQVQVQEIDSQKLLSDPAALSTLIRMMDQAMPHIVVSPVVKLHYDEVKVGKTTVTKMIPPEDREEGVVYTDQIGFEDKMWLFDWAADGLASMLQFRG